MTNTPFSLKSIILIKAFGRDGLVSCFFYYISSYPVLACDDGALTDTSRVIFCNLLLDVYVRDVLGIRALSYIYWIQNEFRLLKVAIGTTSRVAESRRRYIFLFITSLPRLRCYLSPIKDMHEYGNSSPYNPCISASSIVVIVYSFFKIYKVYLIGFLLKLKSGKRGRLNRSYTFYKCHFI